MNHCQPLEIPQMSKRSLTQQFILIVLLATQASCLDRDFTYNKLLGSWEGANGSDNSWCATYTADARFSLFSRTPVIDMTSHTTPASNIEARMPAEARSKNKTELGVGYAAGYWSVARGGRLSQRGAVVRDNMGRELTKSQRVLQPSTEYVIRFKDNDKLSLQNIENKTDHTILTRTVNCNHFSKDVNMVFNEAIWDENAESSP